MKTVCLLFFLFLALISKANTYYFSSSMGEDSRTPLQAQNPRTPWKTLEKLNAFINNLRPGDSILLKRGDIFDGSINMIKSGKPGLPIIISAYGSGNKPIINGFTTLTHWVPEKTAIWTSDCSSCGARVNLLTIQDTLQGMGRYPNAGDPHSGFRIISSHIKNTSITDSSLTQDPDWTGAELIVRKNRFIIDKSRITSHQATTILYHSGSFYEPGNHFGYFIQNHVSTLDANGEWYYDPATKKMHIFFGTHNPGNDEIKLSTVDTLVTLKGVQFVVLDNLSFRGSNYNSISIYDSGNITVSHCEFLFSGLNAITCIRSHDTHIEDNDISNTNNDAIILTGSNNQVLNNRILNTGMRAGMGDNENSYIGITLNGDHNTIAYNNIVNTGYIPIFFLGDFITVQNNFINRFAMVKDDGGGIYTWAGKSSASAKQEGRKIIGNIVLNGLTAQAGTDGAEGIADGIYLDDNSGNVEVTGNSISKCTVGIYLHNAHEIRVRENTLYDNGMQLYLKRDRPAFILKNNAIHQNLFISKTEKQPILTFSSIEDDIDDFSELDSNYYSSAINNRFSIMTHSKSSGKPVQAYDMLLWKKTHPHDQHSKEIPWPAKSYQVNSLKGSDKINNGRFAQNINGVSSYSSARNIHTEWNSGILDGGSLKVSFSPVSGLPNNHPFIALGVGPVHSPGNYILRFSMLGSANSGKLRVMLRKTGAPYTALTEAKDIRIDPARTENEVLLTPTLSDENASLVFLLEEEDSTVWLDNIQLFEADVHAENPEDYIRFEYNPSGKDKRISLGSPYVDAKGRMYDKDILLPPYSSAVLFKKASR